MINNLLSALLITIIGLLVGAAIVWVCTLVFIVKQYKSFKLSSWFDDK